MNFIERYLTHPVVYWAPTTGIGRDGKPVLAAAVQLMGRWEDKVKLIMDATGRQTVSNATVYLGETPVATGLLWRGLLVDAPTVPRGIAREIKNNKVVESLVSETILYAAYL